MLSLGLAFGEKLINAYASDLKPSINKPETMKKLRHTFPELDLFMAAKDPVFDRNYRDPRTTWVTDYNYFLDFLEE